MKMEITTEITNDFLMVSPLYKAKPYKPFSLLGLQQANEVLPLLDHDDN
jgi:hypothetical protein